MFALEISYKIVALFTKNYPSGGGQRADDEGQGRKMKGNGGRQTERSFNSFLVIPQ